MGRVLKHVIVCEWALYGPEEWPVFEHPDLLFVQALCVELGFADGSRLDIGTHQTEYNFALLFSVDASRPPITEFPSLANVYERDCRALAEFPLGRIDSIGRVVDEFGGIQEIEVSLGDRAAIFKAGEVDENFDGRLRIVQDEESVLIFSNRADFDRTIFNEWAYDAVYLDPAHRPRRPDRNSQTKLPPEP